MSWQLATTLGLGAWKAYEAYKFAKNPVGYSQSHGLLGDPPITFGSNKERKAGSISTNKRDIRDPIMPRRYSKKRGGKKNGVYQGNKVPGRNGYIKRGTAPGIKTFKKKIRTKSAKKGGSSRLFDMVAPPILSLIHI